MVVERNYFGYGSGAYLTIRFWPSTLFRDLTCHQNSLIDHEVHIPAAPT